MFRWRRRTAAMAAALVSACVALPPVPLESGRGIVRFTYLGGHCEIEMQNLAFDRRTTLTLGAWPERALMRLDGRGQLLSEVFRISADGRELFWKEIDYAVAIREEQFLCHVYEPSSHGFLTRWCVRTYWETDETEGTLHLTPQEVAALDAAFPDPAGERRLELRGAGGILLFAWPPEAAAYLADPEAMCALYRARAEGIR